MKNQNIPLAIVLRKIQNGYIFQSLEELTSSKDKSKKSKFVRKPPGKNVPNRLIKEIGLTNDVLVPQISPTPEPQPVQTIEQQPQQNPPIFQITQQQEVSCQIQRETQLPKSPATWFDKQKIQQIEKKEMKQFFCGLESKSPQVYMKYRNFMVEAYFRNPKRYLTKISCRRILRGDVNAIMRVHNFLQKYGLINFAIGYQGNYTFKPNCLTSRFEQKTKPQSSIKAPIENEDQTAQKEVDTDNMTITVINKNFSRTYRASCSNCKLVCGIAWYSIIQDQQSQKNLCFQCYRKLDSKEALQYTKTDIVKKMQFHSKEGKSYAKNAWNIQENIKLLDFMSNSKNQSWKKLIESFGGKRSIQDIVLQFLQFPISNFQLKKAKNKLQAQLKREKQALQIGYNSQDYKNILKNFFEESKYKSKFIQAKKIKQQNSKQEKHLQTLKQQIQSIKSEKLIQNGQNIVQDTVTNQQSKQIATALQITIQKMLEKINYLKENQDLLKNQLKKIENLIEKGDSDQKRDLSQNGHKKKQEQQTGKGISLTLSNQQVKVNSEDGRNKDLCRQFNQQQQKLKNKNQYEKKNMQSSQALLVDDLGSDLQNL